MGKEEEEEERPPLLLISHDDDQLEKQTFYNMLDNRYQTTCLPVLGNKYVFGSAHGWLVLVDCLEFYFEGQCCLWNPTSMEVIELPESEVNTTYYNKCLLSRPPTEPSCFVVFNSVSGDEQCVCRIGDAAGFVVKSEEEKGYRVISMVSFQGVIYGIIQPQHGFKYEFVTVHMVGDTLDMRPLLIDGERPWEVSQPIKVWVTMKMSYLIESPCGNELLLVTKTCFNPFLNLHAEFRVFRVDVGRMECEEIETLNGRTIFISYWGNGFCRSSESLGAVIKPNSIYYTTHKSMLMHVYDLDEGSTITFLLCPGADIDPKTSKNSWVDIPDYPSAITSLYMT